MAKTRRDRPSPTEPTLPHRESDLQIAVPDRYQVQREVGRGGMGRVFAAVDRKLGREVAIKVLAAGASNPEALRRFEQEARAAAQLDHSNIIAVHDIGQSESGPYIVSELLQGETLRQRMNRSRLDVDQAVGYALELARGLCAAHDKGVVHRDLKPGNLFLTRDGPLKILDFGIAKLAHGPSESTLTESGTIIGTVAYMSPEQVRGEHVDQRTDIFSFGAVLHEMLSGAPPFERPTAIETGAAILSDAPAALDDRVPERLAHVVLRCLRKEREERYQSARELLRDLEAVTAGRSPASRGRGRLVAVVAGLAVLLFAGVLMLLKRGSPAETTRIPVAVADFANETGDPDLSGLSGMLITSLEQSHRLSVLTRSRMFDVLRAMGQADTARIDEALGRAVCQRTGVRVLMLASVRRFGAVYTIDLKALDPSSDEYLFAAKVEGTRKEDVPGLIDRLAEKTRASLHERSADIRAANLPVAQITTTNLAAYRHYFRGEELYNQGSYLRAETASAESEFRQAIAIDPQFALAHFGLGMVLDSTFRLPSEELEAALRLGDRLPQRERCLAQAIVEDVRTSKAAGMRRQQECTARFPDDKLIAHYGGDRSYHRGELAVAVPYMERALVLDPTFAMAAEHLATALQGLGRVQEQMTVARRFAADAPGPFAESLVAFAQEVNGDPEQALRTSRRAAESFPQSAEPWLRLATGMVFRGEPDAAEAQLRPLLERLQLRGERNAISQALIRIDVSRGRYRAAIAAMGAAADAALAAGDRHEAAQNLYWRALIQAAGLGDAQAARQTLARLRSVEPGFDFFMVLADLDDVQGAEALGYVNDYFSDLWIAALRARQAGRVEEAMAGFEQLAKVPYIGAQMRCTLARLQLEAGKPNEAIATLKQLQSTYPGVRVIYWDPELWFPRSYYLLGVAYERAGNRASALQAYQRFLSLRKNADPDSQELRNAAARAAALRAPPAR